MVKVDPWMARDGGGLAFVGAAHESGGEGFSVDGEALPEGGFDDDFSGGDLRISGENVVDELLSVALHGGGLGFARDEVDGVLHRVGGEDLGVVAKSVRGVEVAGEEDLDGPLVEVVVIEVLGEAHEADARFAVAVGVEFGGHGKFLVLSG